MSYVQTTFDKYRKFPPARKDDKWRVAWPIPKPITMLQLKVLYEDLNEWRISNGMPPISTAAQRSPGIIPMEAVVNTGTNVCIIGYQRMRMIQFEESGLLPNEYQPTDASGFLYNVIGCLLAELAIGNRVTSQVLYVIREGSKLTLSAEAAIDLGLLSETFPLQIPSAVPAGGAVEYNSFSSRPTITVYDNDVTVTKMEKSTKQSLSRFG